MSNKDTSFSTNAKSLNCNGKLLDFEETRVMGILNLTPDSFYDGGKFHTEDHWIGRTEEMLEQGAHIIDLGAFSSKPGARLISEQEELDRLIPALKLLNRKFPNTIFSIDTYRSEIARQSFDCGAGIINDISGGNMDDNMFKTIVSLKIPYVMMHMHGTPESMQKSPIANNIVNIVQNFFIDKIEELKKMNFDDVIIDPGYGFGKSLESNYQLLKHQNNLRVDDLPILAGMSRKSMINKILNTKPQKALNGTTAINMLALQNGANILRVHDVKEAMETVKLFEFYKGQK